MKFHESVFLALPSSCSGNRAQTRTGPRAVQYCWGLPHCLSYMYVLYRPASNGLTESRCHNWATLGNPSPLPSFTLCSPLWKHEPRIQTLVASLLYITIDLQVGMLHLELCCFVWPSQPSCIGSSVGRASAKNTECCVFESRLRQLILELVLRCIALSVEHLMICNVCFLTDKCCISVGPEDEDCSRSW